MKILAFIAVVFCFSYTLGSALIAFGFIDEDLATIVVSASVGANVGMIIFVRLLGRF